MTSTRYQAVMPTCGSANPGCAAAASPTNCSLHTRTSLCPGCCCQRLLTGSETSCLTVWHVPMALSSAQKGVLRGVGTGLVLIAVLSLYNVSKYSTRSPIKPDADSRVLLWLKWNAPKAACLAGHVVQIGNHRFLTPEDINGAGYGPGTPQIRIMQATLQNTLEQLVLAIAASGAFAALAPAQWLVLIPTYSLLFILGRVLFVSGYGLGAPGRALGFCLTMMPTLFMLASSCFLLLRSPW